MFYITPSGAKNLATYQYSGSDLSLVYTYLLTPMNKVLINLFPLWVAPNVITLLSLLFGVAAYVVTCLYSPRMDVAMPYWVYLFVAVMLFLYQTFDNLDGRQARRTGTSSPLGLLFDHGCDAFNITMSVVTVSTCYCTGITWETLHMWAIGYTTFVGATWEEYYTGSLVLGYINGPTDGILISIACLLLNVVYGEGLYCNTIAGVVPEYILYYIPLWLHSYSAVTLLIIAGYLTATPTFLSNIYFIYAHLIKTKSSIPYWDPPLRLLPFVVLFASIFIWRDVAPELYENYPRIYFFTFGCLFCNIICKLMLAHLCHEVYNPIRLVMIPLLLGILNSYYPNPYVSNELALCIVFILNTYFWVHFVVHIINECCEVLDINAFTIKAKKVE